MRKGISATELIVALAVGLIVIIGLGYLVWTWLGRGGGKVNEQYCNGQVLTYCSRWAAQGYDPEGVTTIGGTKKLWNQYDPDCAKLPGFGSVGSPDCERILGQGSQTPTN